MVKRVLMVALVMMLASVPLASAASTAVVGVTDTKVYVGQEVTVPVWITGVVDLYGADVRVTYNPNILQGVRVTRGTFLQPGFVVRQGFYGPPQCNPMCARYALTQLNPAPPVSGDGILMWVTFRALRQGQADLTIYAQLATRDGISIPVNYDHGMVLVLDDARDQ